MRIGVPAGSRTVSWTPLILALGLHLLLVLAWTLRPEMQGVAPAASLRETVLVLLAPPLRPAPAPAPRPAPLAAAAKAARPLAPPVAPAPEPEPAVAAANQAPAPAQSDPVQSPATPAALPGDLLAASKRLAGRIGRELGQDGTALGAAPERKWDRFADTVASARTSGSMAVAIDRYTADDGVSVYRKTVGSRVACYRSGGVGGLNPADGQTAGNIPCPPGARWTRL